MKRITAILLLVLPLFACGDSAQRVTSHEIIFENYHIGEYAVQKSPEEIITVRRDGPEGLLILNLQSKIIVSLDSTAQEARDIYYQNGWIVYRVGNGFRIWHHNQITYSQTNRVERVRGIIVRESTLTIAIDTPEGSSLLTLDHFGNVQSELILPGSVRELVTLPSGTDVAILKTSSGLFLFQIVSPFQVNAIAHLTPEVEAGTYTRSLIHNDKFFLASFHGDEGSLTLFSAPLTSLQTWTAETIEPKNIQTYRGHDIVLFPDQTTVGLIYLDAWALKLRLAEKRGGVWRTEQLALDGAIGFYTVILAQDDRQLDLVTHAFRSDHSDRRQSFEDLHRFSIVRSAGTAD